MDESWLSYGLSMGVCGFIAGEALEEDGVPGERIQEASYGSSRFSQKLIMFKGLLRFGMVSDSPWIIYY